MRLRARILRIGIAISAIVVMGLAIGGTPASARKVRSLRSSTVRSSSAPGPVFFSGSSVWNQPLAPNAPLDPSSKARIEWLLRYLAQPGHGPWINTYQYSVPIYRVPASQPTIRVKLDGWAPTLQSAWQSVPLPPNATPTGEADAALVIYQPSTDKMWEFWQLTRQPDGVHARWGGAMAHVSSNPGYYSRAAWPGLTPDDGWDWGSSASSLPAVAGLMTISELRSGRIDHALSAATPEACAGFFAWPAQRTDGQSSDVNCLPEGAHLRLDPTLDLSKLNLPPVALTMARAMQRYGIIIHDTTHSSFSFFAELPTGGPDPYVGSGGVFGGLLPWQFLSLIPWDRLQLLLMRVCTESPCVVATPARSRGRKAVARHSAHRP